MEEKTTKGLKEQRERRKRINCMKMGIITSIFVSSSSPVNGSSNKSISDLVRSARKIAVRRFIPPLKVDTGRFKHSSGSRRHIVVRISSMENSEDFPFCTIITFSKGENVGQSRSSWKTVEIRRGRETSLSEPKPEPELAFQTISPSSAFSNPIRMRNKVVFPVPEGLIRQ